VLNIVHPSDMIASYIFTIPRKHVATINLLLN